MATDFTAFLSDLDNGRVHQQLGELVERIVDGVQTHGKQGELKLTLKFDKEGAHCVVSASTAVKVPTEPLHPSIFFFDHREGGLTREDPRQLQLRDLTKPQVKEVDRG